MADNQNKIGDNILRNALVQSAGSLVSEAFGGLMIGIGVPEAIVATPLVRGAAMGVVNYCYNDITQRMLSNIEGQKVNEFSRNAVQIFYELAEKDGVTAMTQQIEDADLQFVYEVAEDAMLTAIRQSERTKVQVLGRYFGGQLYRGSENWQDMHQMLTMAGTLTLRQLVMIRLISEDFNGLDKKLFVSNPSACVEINRLLDYGIWQTEGASFGTNDSRPIQLSGIIPTDYSKQVNESLMLDRLSEEDMKRTIDSLRLTQKGTSQESLTQKEFKERTEWQEYE